MDTNIEDFKGRLEKTAALFLEALQVSQQMNINLSSISLVCQIIEFIQGNEHLRPVWTEQINEENTFKFIATDKELIKQDVCNQVLDKPLTRNKRTTKSKTARNNNLKVNKINDEEGIDDLNDAVANYSNEFINSSINFNASLCNIDPLIKDEHLQCSYCDMTFMDRGNLKSHLRLHEKEKRFSCDTCNKTFIHSHQLTRHKRVHSGEKPYQCPVCKKDFTDTSNLNRHQKKEHPNHACSIKCEECGKQCQTKKALLSHMKAHEQEKLKDMLGQEASHHHTWSSQQEEKNILTPAEKYICQICGKSLNKRAALLAHMKRHVNKRDFHCEFCAQVFPELQDLKSHRQQHTGQRPYRCEQCGKGFKSKGTLRSHLGVHSGEHPYSCDVCGRCFSQTSGLNLHKLKHTAEEERTLGGTDSSQFSCGICGRSYKTKFRLQLHVKSHDNTRDVSCDFCDKKFQTAHDLSIHRRSHTKDKYSCRICNASFESRSSYYFHTTTHEIDRPHVCVICGKSFVSLNDLKTHKRRHNAEQSDKKQNERFICKVCGRIYKMKNSLTIHMKMHQGIFDHPCDYCDKKFKSHAELRHHRRTHTQEKPYTCETCNRCFSRHSTLVNHRRIHSGERPYLCMSCGAAFKLSCTLKKHSKIHAREALGEKRKTNTGKTKNPRKKTPQADIEIQQQCLSLQDLSATTITVPLHHTLPLHQTTIAMPQIIQKPTTLILESSDQSPFIHELKPEVASLLQEDSHAFLQDRSISLLLDTRNPSPNSLLAQPLRELPETDIDDRDPTRNLLDIRNSMPIQYSTGNTFTTYYYY